MLYESLCYSPYLFWFCFQFNKTLRKTEGQKTPKVELSISIDGVSIQEPKTKVCNAAYCIKIHLGHIQKICCISFQRYFRDHLKL